MNAYNCMLNLSVGEYFIYDISIHSDYTQLCTKFSVAGCSKGQCGVWCISKGAFINNIEL